MAALRLDQARTGAVSAIVGTGEAQVTPRPGRYEIDTSCSAVTFRTRHLFGLAPVRGSFTIRAGVTAYRGVAGRYLDMTMEVRCVRT
jgi:polyisoprenoid-binding protein YceI